MAGDSNVGGEVKRLRQAAGLTQAALAEKIGVTAGYVTILEKGHRDTFAVAMMFKLSAALGVSCDHWRPFFAPDVPAASPSLAAASSPEVKPRAEPAAKPARKRKPKGG